jgi:hypothetical protein
MCKHRDDADALTDIQRQAGRAIIKAELGLKDESADRQLIAEAMHEALMRIVYDASCPFCDREKAERPADA